MYWSSKKQTSVSLSTAKAEYVAAGQCCVQLLWMRQTLRDFGYNLSKVPLLCDNESAIRMADNPVEHSRTKHIDIRHHFLRDHQQKGDMPLIMLLYAFKSIIVYLWCSSCTHDPRTSQVHFQVMHILRGRCATT
jgi:hypothetical protein